MTLVRKSFFTISLLVLSSCLNFPLAALESVQDFYKERANQWVWITSEGLTPCGQEAVQMLAAAAREGLDPQRYIPLLEEISVTNFSDSEECSSVDRNLTQALLDYISLVGGERNNLRSFDKDLYIKEKSIDEIDILKKGLASKGCGWMQQLPPQHKFYQNLKKVLLRYQQKQKEGGWPQLPADLSFKKGDPHPQVKILRQQLIAQETLEKGQDDSLIFDEKVEAALKNFQLTHGLQPTGSLNKETLAALNKPVESRVKEIALNLERWRWLPADLGERYLIVNIPTYELYGIQNNKTVLTMPIIVGRAYRRTPIFTSKMTAIILNPPWTVPASIARDKIGSFSKNPGRLRAGKYRVFTRDGHEVPAESVSWSNFSRNYVLRQDPGSQNALGKIKFFIQNPFSIFLHGTPDQTLFQSQDRAKSSGCIRVAFPNDLALFALNGNPKWPLEALKKTTLKNTTQSIFLPQSLPVYLTYMTVWVDEEGRPHFAKDIYHKNESVEKMLKAQRREFN